MEVMVGIIVMVIAYGIIYQAYRYTSQMFEMSKQRDEEVIKMVRFYHIMQHDIVQCNFIKPSEFGFDLFYNDNTTIYYQLFNNRIKRIKGYESEEFNIDYKNIETRYIENSNEYLGQVKFDMITNKNNTLPVNFLKKYDNAFLFNVEMGMY